MIQNPRALLLSLIVASSPLALAADKMLEVCTQEIKKFGCEPLSETYAYECLHKHKAKRHKDKGFTSSCFKAYAAYEQSSGKGDRIDSHQVDQPEHVN